MGEYYFKENNMLQLSLFCFNRHRPEKTFVKWEDDGGKYSLECNCKYGAPGSFEQDCYTAVMRIWVKKNMPKDGISLNYSDIARELKLSPPRAWVTRIKKALKRMGMARYEFVECFIDATQKKRKKLTTSFSLFDTASLFEYSDGKSKRNSESYLVFPAQVQKNLEANYYQKLDMAWFRALPEGLSRRLYEYLDKRKYHSDKNKSFRISEEAICRWLPIKDVNVTKRRNRLKKVTMPLVNLGYLSKYDFDKVKKIAIFTYTDNKKPINQDQVEIIEVTPTKSKTTAKSPDEKPVSLALLPDNQLQELITLVKLKRIPKALKDIITSYYNEKGYDYVKGNILYANDKSKSRYSAYLSQALEKNWGAAWYEEESENIDKRNENQRILDDLAAGDKPKPKIEQSVEYKQTTVDEMFANEPVEEIAKSSNVDDFMEKATCIGAAMENILRNKAESDIPQRAFNRPLVVKLQYGQVLLGYLNDNGENFDKSILEDVEIANGLWKKAFGD